MHSYWLPFISTNGSTQIDNSHMGNGSDAITQPNGHNQIDNEGNEHILIACLLSDDGFAQFVDSMTNQGEGLTQSSGENQIGNEGDSVLYSTSPLWFAC
jgi:hypothetical protein